MKQDDEVHVSLASDALERSLRRALRNHKRAQKKLKADPVHDFRVALRRCRSLAEGLSAIDPDPVWRRLRKAAKRQQQALSDLRDIQVLTGWLEPLHLTRGPVGQALTSHFRKQERRARREAQHSLQDFPRKRWKRWLRRLPAGTELIRVNKRRLSELLLEQLTHIIDLHARWTKQPGAQTWHELRVSVKRFRYMVESFLPQKSETWGSELQRAQDLLGEGHDLDVLHDLLLKLARKKSLPKTAVSQSLRRINSGAQKRRDEYVSLISEPPNRNGHASHANRQAAPASNHGTSARAQTLWDRWRTELADMASISRQAGEGSSRSVPRTALRVRARASRYPGRPRRISSTP
jgi:CHAD domain-containing protein